MVNLTPLTINHQPLIIMKNFFQYFGLPVSFLLDEGALKSAYLKNSKKYHPDFFTLEREEKQTEILEQSTLNNQAYRTLADFDKRMKYVLELKGVLKEEGSNQIPADFLSEMMDVNEALMELEFDFDPAVYEQALAGAKKMEADLLEGIMPILQGFDEEKTPVSELNAVKDFFLKKRYLLRLFENLNRFAPA